jgi:lipopolysaccharide/colanic/teichoic acid biosynthesis glycosyltransferase
MSVQQDAVGFAPDGHRSASAGVALSRAVLGAAKRAFDVATALAGLPVLLALVVAILLLNRSRNPGPLFFTQQRMGRGCVPFTIVKFRTMLPARAARGFDDPLEVDRITPFGAFLRRSRLDELPQLLNVLRGEMSIVGPRPDLYTHATSYLAMIPGYRERHAVRPGITGLAQTKLGYAEGLEATVRKVEADLEYIRAMSFRLEARIVRHTFGVMLTGFGAR